MSNEPDDDQIAESIDAEASTDTGDDASVDKAIDEASADDDPADEEQVETAATTKKHRFFSRKRKTIEEKPDYDIRICTVDDLDYFDADAYIHPEIVRSWLALQQFGEATVLVMWFKERTPTGQAVISWTGDWNDEIRKKLTGIPSICNLHVDDEHRGKHIGRKLVAAAEKLVSGSGYSKVTMSVAEANKDARSLYEKLGYEDSGLRSTTTYTYRDSEGEKNKEIERSIALVKEL